jgi:hypothetical protein
MRDLTEQLSTDIAKAINTFRDVAERMQDEFKNAMEGAQEKFAQDIAAAHQVFEVASSLRVEQAHKDMAAQITTFLGQPKPQERLPDVAEGPDVVNINVDNGEAVK